MPEKTLKALAAHGDIDGCIPARACKGDEVLAKFNKAGIHIEALGDQLQVEGAASFVKSWNELLQCIASKSETLKAA
jgi:transaldolase